ncbi:hypothetical protein [Conexibacter sp. DBS9H8]|uniref:hypothetical protein n=1 Tax=Conexibacter sp. DBS9H8 TaxID=2937801 RepID=UPI00200FA827|nr:hypothetical protein [Conexibacter sp. DBS9H8]
MALSTAPITAGSLIGGYLVARTTQQRQLGGAVLALGGALSARQWQRHGTPTTAVLLGTYLGGFGISHPLAKKIGAWPAVLSVAAVSAGASHLLADRRADVHTA